MIKAIIFLDYLGFGITVNQLQQWVIDYDIGWNESISIYLSNEPCEW